MYSFSYLEPGCCSMSSCNCCFLTCIQISQEAGQVVWYSHLFQNFLQNFSLIPRMLIFTHVISCLTIFSLPWFMDLTFQVPMRFCSYSIGLYFHHQTHPQLGKPLLYSFLENPNNSMKRQKYRTLKEELSPGLLVSNMLLENSGEIASEGMKRLSQSRNNPQFWMSLVWF